MELPRIDPVGIREPAEGFEESPRQWSAGYRIIVSTLLAIFVVVTVVTTAVSLGAYCLTTDAADVRELPRSFVGKSE